MTAPVLSVVIPTHNRPAMLPEAVDSALVACPAGAEIIVVDDRSRTAASDILAGVGEGRLRVVPNTGPQGASGARNTGVAAARAELVLFLDDDDWLLPGYPSRVIEAAQGAVRPAFGFCATEPLPAKARQRRTPGLVPGRSPLRRRLVPFSAGFWVRRELYLSLGGCDTAQRVDEDTEFCCRLAARGLTPWYDPQPGVRLRTTAEHAERLTRATPGGDVVACYRRTWDRHQSSFAPYSEARWHLAIRLIRCALRTGHPEQARAAIAAMQPVGLRAALWTVFQGKRIGRRLRGDGVPAGGQHA